MAGEAAPRTLTVNMDGLDSLAAGTERSYVVRAPFSGVVSGVIYTPAATITGAATNSRRFTLRQRGQAGVQGVGVADLTFGSGVNATAFVAKPIPLSATPSDLVVAEGDILEFYSRIGGTGAVDPGGTLSVTFTRITP